MLRRTLALIHRWNDYYDEMPEPNRTLSFFGGMIPLQFFVTFYPERGFPVLAIIALIRILGFWRPAWLR